MRRVDMQVPPDLVQRDERGQSAFCGGLHLASVLAQLRRDPGQAETAVDILLGGPGDAFLALENAVLVDLQPLGLREAAQLDVVVLRAGEVLKGGAEALRRHNSQVNLKPLSRADAALRAARRQHLRHVVE